jgi:protein ImuB
MCLDVTLARISRIVGEDCVGSPVLKDTHQPDAFRLQPFTVISGTTSATNTAKTTAAVRQLRPAERVSVTLRDQRPAYFFFRERRYDIEYAYGPWSTGGEWWSPTLWQWEQWDLIARSKDGLLLCCCLVRDLSQNIYQMVALYD